jgi:hypothetical protein
MRFACGALVVEVLGLEHHADPYWDVVERFSTDNPADVTVRVEGVAGARRPFSVEHPIATAVDRAAGVIDINVYTWKARFDMAHGVVRVTLAEDWVPAFDQLMKTVAQVYTTYLRRGLILHASAVVRHGRAVVFAARSETGKSTVARISQELGCPVLTEEMACIVGLGGFPRPIVRAMPVREKEDLLVKEPLEAPLAAIYWLAQAATTRIDALEQGVQVQRLAMSAAIGVRDALLMGPALDAATRLVDQVPVKLLHFERSPRLWEVVDADLARG